METAPEFTEVTAFRSRGENAESRPVSTLWIVGTLGTILTFGGLTAFLLKPRGAVLEPVEAQAELFSSTSDPLPFELVAARARRLPSKEVVLTYTLRDEEGRSGQPAEGSSEDVASPIQLTLMSFPRERAESVLEEQFQKLRFDSAGGGGGRGSRGRGGGGGGYGGGGGKGGSAKPKLQDAGFLDWQGFSANYARLRHSLPKAESGPEGGSESEPAEEPASQSYDSMRVNLSTGGRCIIAYVKFPVGRTGSKEVVEELLEAFEPLPPLP